MSPFDVRVSALDEASWTFLSDGFNAYGGDVYCAYVDVLASPPPRKSVFFELSDASDLHLVRPTTVTFNYVLGEMNVERRRHCLFLRWGW